MKGGIIMFDDIFETDFFDDDIVEEDVDTYNSYDDAYEDVDVFDENYFEAMEGPARDYRREQNADKKPRQIRKERANDRNRSYGPYSTDFNPKERLNNNLTEGQRYCAHRRNSMYNVGPNTIKRTRTDKDGNVYSVQAEQRNVADARMNGIRYKTYAFKD